MHVCVHTQAPWNCTTSLLLLKYLLKQSGFFIPNHEHHNCADSPVPEMTKGKELTLRDPCSPQQGLSAAFEASPSSVRRLAVSLCRSHQLCCWYPAQHGLQQEMMGSIHPDNNTNPFWTLLLLCYMWTWLTRQHLSLQSKHTPTCVTLTGRRLSFSMGWSWKPTRLGKFFSVKTRAR